MDKIMRMARSAIPGAGRRPVMLAIAGDSAAGKTTLTRGLVEAVGPDRCLSVCVDDYHRFDREERTSKPFTPLHPDCNHIDIMEQHLQLLATGQPILKPVYDHTTGAFGRPQYVEPKEFVIVEGLHPLSTKLARACFDITVFLDPPEEIRHAWKVARDTTKRGYAEQAVRDELERREPESAAYIRPQRRWADIVVRFAPVPSRNDPPGTPLSAELLLRPTIRHPDLTDVLTDDVRESMHLKVMRDQDGTPTDCVHVHGHASSTETHQLEKAIWTALEAGGAPPSTIGVIGEGQRSEPLALTQLMLLFHLLQAREELGS